MDDYFNCPNCPICREVMELFDKGKVNGTIWRAFKCYDCNEIVSDEPYIEERP